MSPEKVSKKIKSFAHSEFNKFQFTNVNQIIEKINSHKDLFGRNFNFKIIQDKELPIYIIENREKFSDFLF
jgi:beta-1,4-mannosyl-glycoprotein beta-1,4-N-acetylglucosaminyltransferase